MKTSQIAVTVFTAAALACAAVVYAQSGAKPDPVKVDPKHYKVEFENENVRVLRSHYAPGEKSVMHYHPKAVEVYLSDEMPKMPTPDGKTQQSPVKSGAPAWAPAGSHLPQNIG